MKDLTYENLLGAMRQAVAKRGEGYVYPFESEADFLYDEEDPDWQEMSDVGKAAERANHVNYTCNYVTTRPGGEVVGSCIVGEALILLGLEPEYLLDESQSAKEVLANVQSWTNTRLSYKAGVLATAAQVAQDRGTPWGKALDEGIAAAGDEPE